MAGKDEVSVQLQLNLGDPLEQENLLAENIDISLGSNYNGYNGGDAK